MFARTQDVKLMQPKEGTAESFVLMSNDVEDSELLKNERRVGLALRVMTPILRSARAYVPIFTFKPSISYHFASSCVSEQTE